VQIEHPTDVVEELPGVNHRYARELLGMLVTDGLAEVHDDPHGGADVWRLTQKGSDLAQQRRHMVELNQHTGHQPKETPMASTKTKTSKTTTPAAKATKTGEARFCGCGCGAQVAGKSQFRQGHDARMVSQVVAAVTGWNGKGKTAAVLPPVFTPDEVKSATAGSMDIQESITRTTKAIEAYFGSKLAAKANAALMSGWDKAVGPSTKVGGGSKTRGKSAKKAEAPKVVKAKVGRWTKEGHLTAEGDLITTDAKGNEQVVAAGKFKLIEG
jgi:hypothetical protein